MTQSTSSAVYTQLFRYSNVALQLDTHLLGEARSLRGALEHFEATCREGAYRLSVAHVADELTAHALRASAVDAWVRVIGHGFQAADSGGWAALLPSWLLPWILRPPYGFWPVDPGFAIGPRLPSKGPQLVWPPFPWNPPDWIKIWPWWPDYRRIEIPWQPEYGPILIKDPVFVIDDKMWPEMPHPTDQPANSGNTGETELGKILRPHVEPDHKEVLRQDQVEKGDSLLDAARYERDAANNLIKEGAWFGSINTVSDHIKAYGCLMTSFTMLLRDLGQNTRVTDLYRANYKKKTGRSIDEDLARNDDQDAENKQDVVLQDLNLDYNAIKDATGNRYQAADGENLTGDATGALSRNLAAHGSVIIQVKTNDADGHWVVVDSYDAASDTFTLRDPMKGLVTGVKIPSNQYKPKGPVKYLQPI